MQSLWYNLVDIDTKFMIDVPSNHLHDKEMKTDDNENKVIQFPSTNEMYEQTTINDEQTTISDEQTTTSDEKMIRAFGNQYVTAIMARSVAIFAEDQHKSEKTFGENQLSAFRFAADVAEATFNGDAISAVNIISSAVQQRRQHDKGKKGLGTSKLKSKRSEIRVFKEALNRKERTYMKDEEIDKKSRMCCIF